MKNKFSLATLVAMGLMVISCSTDTEEMNTSSQKQQDELNLKIVDSVNKTPPALYAGEDGVIPPIKP